MEHANQKVLASRSGPPGATPVGVGLTGLAPRWARSPVGSAGAVPHPEPKSSPDTAPGCPTPPSPL